MAQLENSLPITDTTNTPGIIPKDNEDNDNDNGDILGVYGEDDAPDNIENPGVHDAD